MIYKAPDTIKRPSWNDDYEKDTERYLEKLKNLCHTKGTGKYTTKIARFQVGDGYAEYMVISLRPLKLLHVDIGDCWEYQYIDRLKATDIKQNIDQQEAMAKLFSK